jgi:hypothetical protein
VSVCVPSIVDTGRRVEPFTLVLRQRPSPFSASVLGQIALRADTVAVVGREPGERSGGAVGKWAGDYEA